MIKILLVQTPLNWGGTPKTDDEQKTHKQHLMEALACSCEHLGVIKFFTIHALTMEAYTF